MKTVSKDVFKCLKICSRTKLAHSSSIEERQIISRISIFTMPDERLNSFSKLFIKAGHENAASKLFLNIEVFILEAKLKVCLIFRNKKVGLQFENINTFKFLV